MSEIKVVFWKPIRPLYKELTIGRVVYVIEALSPRRTLAYFFGEQKIMTWKKYERILMLPLQSDSISSTIRILRIVIRYILGSGVATQYARLEKSSGSILP